MTPILSELNRVKRELPQFLSDLLANVPQADRHVWFYKVARQLHAHLPAGEIVQLLEERAQYCGRHVPRREIVAAVKNALSTAWQPNKGSPLLKSAEPLWPLLNTARREAIIRDGGKLADLWEASPIRL